MDIFGGHYSSKDIIDYYEFYGYNATYNLEDELGISENNTIKITGFKNGYTYKVKVYDLAGNVSEETLYESCKLETEGTCTSGTQIDTYKCDPTGRTYNVPKSCSNYSGGPSSGTGSSSCCSSVGSACKSSCSNYTDSTEKADCNARCDAQQSECAAQNAANGLC